jgi:hypothetical protein
VRDELSAAHELDDGHGKRQRYESRLFDPQDAEEWDDLGDDVDATFFIDIRSVTSPGGTGFVTLYIETAPSARGLISLSHLRRLPLQRSC